MLLRFWDVFTDSRDGLSRGCYAVPLGRSAFTVILTEHNRCSQSLTYF